MSHVLSLWGKLFQGLHLVSDPPTKTETNTSTVDALVHGTATFHCFVTVAGNPDNYTFSWTRQNDSSWNEATHTGMLLLDISSVDQEDTYYCSPQNKAGHGSTVPMKLNVYSERKI